MTGAIVYITRNNKKQGVDIDQLTDPELDAFFKAHPDEGCLWAKYLAKWIRDLVVGEKGEKKEEKKNED